MRFKPLRRLVWCTAVAAITMLNGSCATTKVMGTDIKRVYNGQPVDRNELSQAVASDTKDLAAELVVLKRQFAEVAARLRANVQKRWGQGDTKVADRTVYVKYTQGYKSRVVTDFDHGSLTVETLDDKDPQRSLKTAIVAALLTSNEPGSVDLFSDKDVTLDANRKPYLFGLVHDNHGKSIRTREQAEQFANYLVPAKAQSHPVKSEQGDKTGLFVRLIMVRNFEAKGAERYRTTVDKYAEKYHVSPSLVLAIIRTESNFNPFAVSGAPAYGLMQLVPTSGGRAAYKRVQGIDATPTQEYLFDPDHNIELGSAYLDVLNTTEFHAVTNPASRDYCVIAAYNGGARSVTRTFAGDKSTALNDINAMDPPALFAQLQTKLPSEETRQYVGRVAGYRGQFLGAAPAATAE